MTPDNPRYVKLDDVVEAVKRLFAIPPCEGAYRAGDTWAIGSGSDRSVFAGYDPTESQVLAEIDKLDIYSDILEVDRNAR